MDLFLVSTLRQGEKRKRESYYTENGTSSFLSFDQTSNSHTKEFSSPIRDQKKVSYIVKSEVTFEYYIGIP